MVGATRNVLRRKKEDSADGKLSNGSGIVSRSIVSDRLSPRQATDIYKQFWHLFFSLLSFTMNSETDIEKLRRLEKQVND